MEFRIYKDKKGEWRWRAVHKNGRVLADSGESYKRKGTMLRVLRRFKHRAPDAPIVAAC